MNTFYHPLPISSRPRVLGLTASPLINVKPRVTVQELQSLLQALENNLHATLTSISALQLPNMSSFNNNLTQTTIHYQNHPPPLPWPPPQDELLLPSRIKELLRLEQLYTQLGPLPTKTYCQTLLKEISRNKYEEETQPQYEYLLQYIQELIAFLSPLCLPPHHPRSNKLIALESLLHDLYNTDTYPQLGHDKIGIVFVETRITALALCAHLRTLYTDHIRCDMIMRQTTHAFKYMHPNHKLISDSHPDEEWHHISKNIRRVLDGLRTNQINLLISTSVVEEGIDVGACSFVIVLDGLKTTKGYIQMKGRARRKHAHFFVFEDDSATLSLQDAQDAECMVNNVISSRASRAPVLKPRTEVHPDGDRDELEALQRGQYRTMHAFVDLSSAKSLINRYSLSIPMDALSRTNRRSFLVHMPVYNDDSLLLNAHLPKPLRLLTLPPRYHFQGKRVKHNMLALMACVRLHNLKVLNDYLLPLERKDMHERLLSMALVALPHISIPCINIPPPLPTEQKQAYVYPLLQMGHRFHDHDFVLENGGEHLALISLSPIQHSIPNFTICHKELNEVEFSLGRSVGCVMLTGQQWDLCAQFYTVLMNARWRKRTGRKRLIYKGSHPEDMLPLYLVISVAVDGSINWNRMQNTIREYTRTQPEKQRAASLCRKPRLWCPLYDPNVTYIAFCPSSNICSDAFPYDEHATYRDYFLQSRSFNVSPNCVLVAAQRQWHLPQTTKEEESVASHKKRKKEHNPSTGNYAPCRGLNAVLLPQDACMETPLPDAGLFLHCVLLPQALYHIHRCLTARSFVHHCQRHFSVLGSFIHKIPLQDILQALTAKSCSLPVTYDRLEFLGDAVLKLIHTDALQKTTDEGLQRWISCLHEGDLTLLRSEMGCNARLNRVAHSIGLDRYILTVPLGRGQWTPPGLDMIMDPVEGGGTVEKMESSYVPSEKVCADVVESVLGLIYLNFGYRASVRVAEELCLTPKVTLPDQNDPSSEMVPEERDPMTDKVNAFLGIQGFSRPELMEEALTHASFIHSSVPSYQRLEWIGDAVLCLAAREFAYTTYPNLSVSDLVIMETTLDCNETLAMLAHSKNLQGCIQHCDAGLPSRLEDFSQSIGIDGKGLWATDPPKVLADVVESLIGAVHIDKGFEEGQKASLCVISPILDVLTNNIHNDSRALQEHAGQMMHPKQDMKEMAMFLSVKSCREDHFAVHNRFCSVWLGDRWGEPDSNSSGFVGQVACCGLVLIAVRDVSPSIARNRACALIASIFRRSPELLECLEKIVSKLNPEKPKM